MLILKIVCIAFTALFINIYLKHSKSEFNVLLLLACNGLILITLINPLKEIMNFVTTMASKANMESVYIEIVVKILAIAYIASFCSSLCRDAGADSLAAQVDFSGKVMILILAVPVLMAVLNSILQIM